MLIWAFFAVVFPAVAGHQSAQGSSAVAASCPVDAGASQPTVGIGGTIQRRVRKQKIADPPQSFLDARVAGRIVVNGFVDIDGSLCDLRGVSSAPAGLGLEEVGIASARSWRFTPAGRESAAVRAPVTIEFTFSAYKEDARQPGVRGRTASANIEGADPLPPGVRPTP